MPRDSTPSFGRSCCRVYGVAGRCSASSAGSDSHGQALAALLEEKGLGPNLVDRVNACLTDAELGRFSPEANDPAHAANLLKEISVLIGELEKRL